MGYRISSYELSIFSDKDPKLTGPNILTNYLKAYLKREKLTDN